MEEKQQEYDEARGKISSNREFFDFGQKKDAEMREVIDSAFGKPVCEDLFRWG